MALQARSFRARRLLAYQCSRRLYSMARSTAYDFYLLHKCALLRRVVKMAEKAYQFYSLRPIFKPWWRFYIPNKQC